MEEIIWEQVGDILEAKDREALEALYKHAHLEGDWKQAHDRLLELTLRLLGRSTKIIGDMRWQQEATAREIEAVGKRLSALIN